ncbi:ABC transporter ATP-binding protein [Thiofilum flexile]|uniref:ABC transporter ATP-binding protein n=1 Tax=Thiofilum flexile TaxID=125627 RepID=UPI000362781D|nr:dipeptide ABC transporter ATP-binding protein [Thiofilum flexile]
MSLLTVRNLRTYINTHQGSVQAVDGISFSINQGETLCLVGESGSGKSITALSILQLFPEGLVTHPTGEIGWQGSGLEVNTLTTPETELAAKRLSYAKRAVSYYRNEDEDSSDAAEDKDSVDLLQLSEEQLCQIRGSQISMIFQEPMTSLNPVFTVGDQIAETLLIHEPTLTPQEVNERVLESLRQVQLPDPEERMNAYPHQLSGGQRQRVMIAMALICKPRLLIADEPTTALDVTVQAEILKLMRKLQAETGMAMLFITHDFGVVAEMAHQVGVMQHGRLVELGTKEQVLTYPQHRYTKQLLAAVPDNLIKQKSVVVAFKSPQQRLALDLKKAANEPKPLIQVKDLSVWFPVKKGLWRRTVDHIKAVDNVSLNVAQGKIVALVGESGCGKTTLGRAIIQLERATSGKVLLEGQELTGLSQRELRQWRPKMQIAFQDPQSSLNPRLLVETTLTEPMKVHRIGANQEERIERAAQILEQVQLKREYLWRYPHEFSGGQRQRIGLARALVLNPRFIVCDEITSALDVSVQAEILELLLAIRAQQNLTLLFITHNIGVVEYLSDETVVMYKGKIVEQGETAQVCGAPTHAYTQTLLAAVPRLKLA